MASTILADNGVSSSSAGIKTSADSTGVLALQTTTSGGTATTAMTIDTSQNVGIGVTPSAWASGSKAINVGAWGAISSNSTSGNTELTNNAYQTTNAGAFAYVNTNAATRYAQALGNHQWSIAASGTAGNAISWTQAMTLDASGNLGVGVTSPSTKLHVGSGGVFRLNRTDNATYGDMSYVSGTGFLLNDANADGYTYQQSGSTKLRIDSSGNLLVGTTSAYTTLTVNGGASTVCGSVDQGFIVRPSSADSQSTRLRLCANGSDVSIGRNIATYPGAWAKGINSGTSAGFVIGIDGGMAYWTSAAGDTSPLTSMRLLLDASGNFMVAKNAASDSGAIGFLAYSGSGAVTSTMNDASSSVNSYHLYNINATNNGYRFYVNTNGGIRNYSGNNTNLSDERTKTNIELAGSYLAKVCAIPVKLFNYKTEAEGEQQTLGVIAQDVEAVAPELVNTEGWLGDAPEGEEPLKSIYTTDMMFALMRSIQEQQTLITQLQADVAELKGQA